MLCSEKRKEGSAAAGGAVEEAHKIIKAHARAHSGRRETDTRGSNYLCDIESFAKTNPSLPSLLADSPSSARMLHKRKGGRNDMAQLSPGAADEERAGRREEREGGERR